MPGHAVMPVSMIGHCFQTCPKPEAERNNAKSGEVGYVTVAVQNTVRPSLACRHGRYALYPLQCTLR